MDIKVQNLTKIYGKQKAVDNISFQINQGEILGFLGPNGAGKSTTMKIITCFIEANEGTVSIGDLFVKKNSKEIRRKIGYLPEHNPLYLDMYVHEFLRFVGKLYQIPKKKLKERIIEVIEMTGLQREQHKKVGMLSKGYRQRVGLAQALIHNPEVLILDEPTSGLDPNQIVEIRNLIKKLGKQKTVIFSTHILSEVEEIADRVVILNRGKIVADENLANLEASAADSVHVVVEFENEGFKFKNLEQANGVVKLEKQSKRKFVIYLEKGADIRKEIYDESIAQNNTILSLNKKVANLEDIFKRITAESGDKSEKE